MQNINVSVAREVTISYASFVQSLLKKMPSDHDNIMHTAVGISGEAGELLDTVKKTWAYGKPLDITNIMEELGDIMFYTTAMMNLLGLDESCIVQENATKLAKRYPGLIYSDAAAVARADKAGETK